MPRELPYAAVAHLHRGNANIRRLRCLAACADLRADMCEVGDGKRIRGEGGEGQRPSVRGSGKG